MWWAFGLCAMLFGTFATAVMLANSLIVKTAYSHLLVRVFGVMLACEILLLMCAIVFIVMAETGRLG